MNIFISFLIAIVLIEYLQYRQAELDMEYIEFEFFPAFRNRILSIYLQPDQHFVMNIRVITDICVFITKLLCHIYQNFLFLITALFL